VPDFSVVMPVKVRRHSWAAVRRGQLVDDRTIERAICADLLEQIAGSALALDDSVGVVLSHRRRRRSREVPSDSDPGEPPMPTIGFGLVGGGLLEAGRSGAHGGMTRDFGVVIPETK